MLDRYPQLYQLSQKGVFFRTHNFWSWVGNGFYHSILLYFVSELIWWDDGVLSDGKIAGHWVWGTALYTAGLVTVLGKAALITNIWTKYTVIAIPGSLAIWFIFLPIYAYAAPKLGFSTEYAGLLPILLSSAKFWLMSCVVLPALCLLRDFAWKYAKRMYYPQSYHHVQEIQKYNIQDYRPRYALIPPSPSTSFPFTDSVSCAGWSNFKKRSAKCARCSACGSSAGMPFRRRTRVRRGCCRLMIRRRRGDGMVR